MHLGPSPRLSCFSTRRGKHLQFNVKMGHIQKLCATYRDIVQFIPFVCAFYAFEFPLFYSHHNHEGDVTIIPFVMGICQGDPLRGALFTLAHFRALHFIVSHFPSCLFPSIVNDTHTIGSPLIISSTHEHFQTKLRAIGLSIQLQKFVTWSHFGLPPNFNIPSKLTTPSKGIRVLGGFVGHFNFHIILHQICLVKGCSTCGPFP
jgi:hypothetical protein